MSSPASPIESGTESFDSSVVSLGGEKHQARAVLEETERTSQPLPRPAKDHHNRRKRLGVSVAVLVCIVVIVVAIVPAAVVVVNGKSSKSRDELLPSGEAHANVTVILEPVVQEMNAMEQIAFMNLCDSFLQKKFPRFTDLQSIVKSQTLQNNEQETAGRYLQEGPFQLQVILQIEAAVPYLARLVPFDTSAVAHVINEDSYDLLRDLQQTGQSYFNQVEAISAPLSADPPENNSAPTSAPLETNNPNACNGLENLCDVPVNEVLFATMHNANSDALATQYAPNHQEGLMQGLRAGIRGVNMDLGKCHEGGDTQLAFVHGSCALGFSNPLHVLEGIHQFLTNNPREVILMPIQVNDDTGGTVLLSEMDDLLSRVIDDQGKSLKDRLYAHPRYDPTIPPIYYPWPTLREMIDQDKRVIFMIYNGQDICFDSENCPEGIHDYFLYSAETAFEFHSIEEITQNPQTSCNITRGLNSFQSFFGLNVFLEIPDQEAAATLNTPGFLLNHVTTCSSLNDGLAPNLVIVDFWTAANNGVIRAVEAYNSELQGLGASSSSYSEGDPNTNKFPLLASSINSSCSQSKLKINGIDECQDACGAYYTECCDPFGEAYTKNDGDFSQCTIDEQVEGCVAYAKCHALSGKIDPAPSALSGVCSPEQIAKDPSTCQRVCQDVACCFSVGTDNCVLQQLGTCLDYAPCANLQSGYLLEPAPPELDVMCSSLDEYSTECAQMCAKAECCRNPDSQCLQSYFVSCLTYAPCNAMSVRGDGDSSMAVELAPQFSVVPVPPTDLAEVCNVNAGGASDSDSCLQYCKDVICCWSSDTSENCFFEDPLGCLAWEHYCQVLFV